MKSTLNPSIKSPFDLLYLILLLLLTALTALLPSSHAALFDQCGFSVVALFTNPVISSCIPIGPINNLLSNDFTVPLVNKSIGEFCSYPICTQSAVSLIENTIVQNCAENPEDKADFMAMFGAASLYVPFKQGLCNQVDPPRNGTYCLTLLSDSLQTYMKKHPSPDGALVFANNTVLLDYLNGLPVSVLCTPCNKAMINPIEHYVAVNQLTLDPSVVSWSRAVQKQVQLKCGDDFIDFRPLAPDPSAALNRGSMVRIKHTWLVLLGLVHAVVVQW